MTGKLEIGSLVRVNLPGVQEHDSVGTVVAIDHDAGYFSVALHRVQPPFRGLYEAGDLVMVEAQPG